APMNGAVECLTGKCLLMDTAIGRAIKEAADAVLQLSDDTRCVGDQRPGELLIVDETAPANRVLEMRLERIGRVEHGVIAALHHPRAATLAEQPFRDDCDVQ